MHGSANSGQTYGRGHILGLDPGVNTGVACLTVGYPNAPVVSRLFATRLPQEVAGYIAEDLLDNTHYPLLAVVIEDFIGYGMRDTSIKTSIMNLGFFRGWCEYLGLIVKVQAPQLRKAFHDQAQQMAGPTASRHGVDALAHTLAFYHYEYEIKHPGCPT
jgi:hypothetical protein